MRENVQTKSAAHLKHVGELGAVHFLAVPPHLFLTLRGLEKGDVRPDFPELFASFKRFLQP